MDGVCLDNASSIKGAIVNFYTELYREDMPRRPFFEGLSYGTISDEDASDLLKEFSEEEVWKAIINLARRKLFRSRWFQYCLVPTLLEYCQWRGYGFIFGVPLQRCF